MLSYRIDACCSYSNRHTTHVIAFTLTGAFSRQCISYVQLDTPAGLQVKNVTFRQDNKPDCFVVVSHLIGKFGCVIMVHGLKCCHTPLPDCGQPRVVMRAGKPRDTVRVILAKPVRHTASH